MARVAGTDPGSSSLDVLILADGHVEDQCRFTPDELRAEPAAPVRWLVERGPYDLAAGPSGYGLPLVRAADCGEDELAQMTLVRHDEVGRAEGVAKFSSLLHAFCQSTLPVVFLPGVIHLPTVPAFRKINRIDLGTPDKLCVAALALVQAQALTLGEMARTSFCVLELGSVFTACLVARDGTIVDGLGGTSGPMGWGSAGCWDGEVAYALSPLTKRDLFSGGVTSCADRESGIACFVESVCKAVGGLHSVHGFTSILLSGRLLQMEPTVVQRLRAALERLARVLELPDLPGAWVKHAAQGAAIVADGLCEGRHSALVKRLALRQASGHVLDWICRPPGGRGTGG